MSSRHLQIPAEDSCSFCDYLAGTRPYTILKRSDLTAMLVTREQRGLSHLLIVTIRHVPTLLDLSEAEGQSVMRDLQTAAAAIDAAEQRPGLSVWQNNGKAADQRIAHFHFHIAGTVPGGGTERGSVPEISIAETDAIAGRLRESEPRLL